MKLLNGTDAPRVKSSDAVTVLECGCAYSERAWLQMCDTEWNAWNARHVTALSDHGNATQSKPGQEEIP